MEALTEHGVAVLRLYFDEDMLDRAVVDGLSRLGIVVTTVTEVGMRGRTDAEQLTLATAGGMVLVSFNFATTCGFMGS